MQIRRGDYYKTKITVLARLHGEVKDCFPNTEKDEKLNLGFRKKRQNQRVVEGEGLVIKGE